MGEVAEFSKGSGYSKSDLTAVGSPIILYGRLYTNYETVIDNVDTFTEKKDNPVISQGDEVIVPSSGETAEDIARASAVSKSGIILGGDLNIIKPNLEINSAFLAIAISNGNQQKELSKKAQGKSVVHLRNSDLQEIILHLPTLPEQTAIGTFFRTLDTTITLHQRKLESLRELKRGYLQKMFPQEGESVPRVRFSGFCGEWKQKQLGNLFTERSERSGEGELISVTINSGVIKSSSLERKDNSSEDKSNYKRVEVGDIAYNSMRMWQGASGVSDYSGILSPAYTVITPTIGVCSVFFSYMFKLTKMIQTFQSSSQGLTSDTWNLKFPLLKNISVITPCYEEQQKIALFFRNLDNQIAAQKDKLNGLKNLKKAYLQKMLV